MNQQLCECGSCQSAYDRALKIVEQMYNDGECPIYQVAVGRSLSMIALYGLSRLVMHRAKQDGLELDLLSAIASAAYNKDWIDKHVSEFLNYIGNEGGPKEVGKMFDAMMARVAADHEATRADNAEIKGAPKG